jgi:hypothetical protein
MDFAICCHDSLIAWRETVLKTESAAPEALRAVSFTGLRGESFIRALEGEMDCSTFFDRLTYLLTIRYPPLNR